MTPNTQPRLSKESMEEAEKICEAYVKKQGGSGFLRGKKPNAEWSWKQHYATWKPLLDAISLALDYAKAEGAEEQYKLRGMKILSRTILSISSGFLWSRTLVQGTVDMKIASTLVLVSALLTVAYQIKNEG